MQKPSEMQQFTTYTGVLWTRNKVMIKMPMEYTQSTLEPNI